MKQRNLTKELIDAGMSEAEAAVYTALLASPSMSIQEITDKVGIPRSTVVLALEKLTRTGVVNEFVYGKRRNFAVRSVEAVEHYIDDAEKEIQARRANLGQLISGLRQAHFLTSSSVLEIEVLKGEEEYKNVYRRILKLKPGSEVLRIDVESEKFIFARDFFKEYSREKNKKKIKTRLLLPESPLGRGVRERDKQGLRETRFLSHAVYNPDSAIVLFDATVAITVWDENLETVVIQSKQVVDIFRSMFELLWINAKK